MNSMRPGSMISIVLKIISGSEEVQIKWRGEKSRSQMIQTNIVKNPGKLGFGNFQNARENVLTTTESTSKNNYNSRHYVNDNLVKSVV